MGTVLWGGTLPVLHPQGVQGGSHAAQLRGSWQRMGASGSVTLLGWKCALLFDGSLNHEEDLLSLRRLKDECARTRLAAPPCLNGQHQLEEPATVS